MSAWMGIHHILRKQKLFFYAEETYLQEICNTYEDSLYLYMYLLIYQQQIETFANGSVQQNLNKDIIDRYNIKKKINMYK